MTRMQETAIRIERIDERMQDGDWSVAGARRAALAELAALVEADPEAARELPRWMLEQIGRKDLTAASERPAHKDNPGSHYNRALRGED